MQEAKPVEGKLVPATSNKRTVNTSRGPEQTALQQQTEHTALNQAKSSPKKKKPLTPPAFLESAEASTAGASGEVSMLLSAFTEVCRERAAADTAQVKKLEDLLTEARNLKSYLKEKKKRLKETLALISDKLQD